jgi:hypothetical protein
MQVGLVNATFSAAAGTVRFDNFMLDATNLTVATATPPGTTNLVSTLNPTNGTLTLTWNPGVPSAGSIVVMRAVRPVTAQPAPGVAYTGNASFGLGDNLGHSNYVVYVGTGNSVTVSNLQGGVTYYSAVYSFNGAGSSTVYNTEVVGTDTEFFGVLQSLAIQASSTRIPVGGIAIASAIGTFSGVPQDISGLATYAIDDPNVAITTPESTGILTGLTNGSITVTASYSGFTTTAVFTVASPTFSDDFEYTNNFITDGVNGTIWDGVYLGPIGTYPTNGIPEGSIGGGSGQTFVASASLLQVIDTNTMTAVDTNGVLAVQNMEGGWEGGDEDGFFLFKFVPGDFQMSVLVTNLEVIGFNTAGLQARAYGPGGAPFSTNGESHVSFTRFDEFGIETYARITIDNGTTQNPDFPDNADYTLLMVRQGTTFRFYQRSNEVSAYRVMPIGTTYSVPAFAGQPMQVGLMQALFNSGNTGNVQFDNFMLDVAPTELDIVKSDNNVTLSWKPSGLDLQSSPALDTGASWTSVGATTTTDTNGITSASVPITNATTFFRLAQ